ncbi:MAG: GatB/YqeY domain-containing protein [Candidatus Omnitrophota bacterium]
MLEKTIQDEVIKALKGGDKTRLSILRMLVAEIKNKKIADKTKDLDDEKVLSLVQKMIRQHKESIEKFAQGKRDDLVRKEEEELKILEEYLPEQISEEELIKIVNEAVKQAGAVSPKDMGRVMAIVMARVGGRADGRLISQKVKESLSSRAE